jgi:hypothetical protein
VCGDTDESLARLWSVSATTAPVGVVPLLGGVTEVCRHLSRYFSSLVDVSGATGSTPNANDYIKLLQKLWLSVEDNSRKDPDMIVQHGS